MTENRENVLARREIVAAYVAVSSRLDEFVRVCSTVQGGREELRGAVQEAFGLTEIAADAVLAMQLHRLSPSERWRAEDELAALDAQLARTGA
ncbi:MAG: hypothetical protein PGN24_02465 [Microbacterium arborescens]